MSDHFLRLKTLKERDVEYEKRSWGCKQREGNWNSRPMDLVRSFMSIVANRFQGSLQSWESNANMTSEEFQKGDIGKDFNEPRFNSDDSLISRTAPSNQCVHKCHSTIFSWNHTSFVHWSDVPEKMQEPYIEYGYLLPFMPWRYYLRGLFIPSYEISNIWSHMIPGLYFIYLLYTFSFEMDIIHAWPLLLITFSAIAVCLCSSLAHLFHARSSLHHSCWFVIDYFGITLYAFSSMASNFYSGAKLEYYNWLSPYYLHIITTISFIGFTSLCITQTKQTWISVQVGRQIKLAVNGFGYGFGAFPLVLRMYETSFGETALQYHALGVLSMLIAPITYSMDFPQCVYPGEFDKFGHSHMWFHIFTAASMYFDIHAVHLDITGGPWTTTHTQHGFPSIMVALSYYLLVMLYGVFSGHLTHCSVKCDFVQEDSCLQGKLLCECGLPRTMKMIDRYNNNKQDYKKQ